MGNVAYYREREAPYKRVYMKARYHRRRQMAIRLLGGRCVCCGTTDDLQFDHVDPEAKRYGVGKRLASLAEDKLQAELAKCQLLCRACHVRKTLADRGQVSARETHGTVSSYRYCRCDLCKGAMRDYNRVAKARRRCVAQEGRDRGP